MIHRMQATFGKFAEGPGRHKQEPVGRPHDRPQEVGKFADLWAAVLAPPFLLDLHPHPGDGSGKAADEGDAGLPPDLPVPAGRRFPKGSRRQQCIPLQARQESHPCRSLAAGGRSSQPPHGKRAA